MPLLAAMHSWVWRGFAFWMGLLAVAVILFQAQGVAAPFVNFETPPIHPIAPSPDGRTLAVCNLPDGRVEFFDVSSGVPRSTGSVLVGIDPVSLRFHTANELWVVNHISRSISVVDLERRIVLNTINTLDGPCDIVFTSAGTRRSPDAFRVGTCRIAILR